MIENDVGSMVTHEDDYDVWWCDVWKENLAHDKWYLMHKKYKNMKYRYVCWYMEKDDAWNMMKWDMRFDDGNWNLMVSKIWQCVIYDGACFWVCGAC